MGLGGKYCSKIKVQGGGLWVYYSLMDKKYDDCSQEEDRKKDEIHSAPPPNSLLPNPGYLAFPLPV